MRVLFISNGYGEDLIATYLIQALKAHDETIKCDAIPLVGRGEHYETIGIKPLIKNPTLPSGGFLRTAKDISTDLKSGLITQLFKQRTMIKHYAEVSDIMICVGDVFCLVMSTFLTSQKAYFLPTAKSDFFMPHSGIEKWIMKKVCKGVFPRDELTNTSLKAHPLPSHFFGNLMMDNMKLNHVDFKLNPDHKIIGILPGSRKEAYKNAAYIETIISELKKSNPKTSYLVAKAPMLDTIKLQNAIPNGIISSEFYDILHQSDLIIGLSGTANEQATYYGKRVLCFPGFGPQTTAKRFKEQQRLLGEKLIYIPKRQKLDILKAIKICLNEDTPFSEPPTQNSASQIAGMILRDKSETV